MTSAPVRQKGSMRLKQIMHSRLVTVLGVAVAVAVPAVTLPRMPHVTLWPVVLGLLPWIVGKYVLCPLRWHALTASSLTRWWHIRAYAEAELLGLFTPGHVGADLWRLRRLNRAGLNGADALTSVGLGLVNASRSMNATNSPAVRRVPASALG